MREIKLRSGIYLLIICLSLAFNGAAQQRAAGSQRPAPAAAKPLPPTQYIPDRDFDTRHIALDLRFDWKKEWAIGTETFTFAPLTDNFKQITLDATNMTFNSVKLAPSGTPLTFASDNKRQKLTVTLDRAYRLNEVVTLTLDYHTNGKVEPASGGILAGFGGGLRFIQPTREDPQRPRQIWSQGESEYNHYWFACYDHPNDFFTSDLTATVEQPFIVVSNGALVETKNNADGTRSFHWKIDEPHAAYLSSIVVGEYAAVEGNYDGIPVLTYVYPNEINEGRATAARLPAMVQFFSEKTGVRYPYPKYAQTMVRDFGGGMENISATTMTDTMILDARSLVDETSDSLQSHELAHQWFGDYVTCRTWADIWLNESFATYFQALWDEKSLGRDDFLYRDVISNQQQYFGAWYGGNRRPIVTKNYANPDAVFDTYAYPRGGAVLHMLRVYLGDENWWRAINHYLTKYAHQPVGTEQFRIAVEEATGQSMDWFFDQWLYRMGHPILRVKQNYNPATKTLTLNVRQEQKPDPASAYPQIKFFRLPVDIGINTGVKTDVRRVWVEAQEEQTLTFDNVASAPRFVSFDVGGTLIKELKFDKPNAELVAQLSTDEDVVGRFRALNQLAEQLTKRETPDAEKTRIATALTAVITQDSFWGMRRDAVRAWENLLAANNGSLAPPNARAALRAALLVAAKDPNARVRAATFELLSAERDPALAPLFLEALNDPSYSVVTAAAQGLGRTKDPRAKAALEKLATVPSWHDRLQAAAAAGLALLKE